MAWKLLVAADQFARKLALWSNTPRLNGKVERSHRIDGEEFYRQLKGVLGGQTPYERLRQKTTRATTPE